MRHITERDKNEQDIQNNCSVCPPFTWTTAFSMLRHWSIDLLVKTPSRCTLFPWDHPSWTQGFDTHFAAELSRQRRYGRYGIL